MQSYWKQDTNKILVGYQYLSIADFQWIRVYTLVKKVIEMIFQQNYLSPIHAIFCGWGGGGGVGCGVGVRISIIG